MTPGENDPLWRLRHALVGVGLALLGSVLLAALLGRWIGNALGGPYGTRVAIYLLLVVYVLVGASVLFVKVAQHETAALTSRRVGLWFMSLWLWPALLATRRRK